LALLILLLHSDPPQSVSLVSNKNIRPELL